MILAALVLAAATALGAMAVRGAWPVAGGRADLVLGLGIAAGIGFGVLGCVNGLAAFYLGSGLGVAVSGIALLAFALLGTRYWRPLQFARPPTPPRGAAWLRHIAAFAFVGLACGALIEFVSTSHAHALGQWDAWAIWNIHARFLFGASNPRVLLASPAIWHGDYPLLMPGLVVAGWRAVGRATPAVPIVVAFGFTAGTVCVLGGGVASLRSTFLGLLAGIILLSTVPFLEQGASQCADVPFGFFVVTTFALLGAARARERSAGRRLMALAGVTAGLAAWTKNEGFLLLISLGVGYAGDAPLIPGRAKLDWSAFALGLGPLLVPLLWFKFEAPLNDLVALAEGNPMASLAKLHTWSRYQSIGAAYIRAAAGFPVSTIAAVGLALGPGLGLRRRLQAEAHSWLALGVMFMGYFLVYVLTPDDLAWHLRTSATRLFVQLWPATLFLTCTALEAPETLLGATARRGLDRGRSATEQ